MKKLLIASALAVSTLFGMSAAAEAKTNVDVQIYLGLPHYSYQRERHYKFRKGYGWYNPGYVVVGKRITCGRAKLNVAKRGYRNISTVECSGPTYTFRGTYRGNRYRLLVNARSGAVWRG